VSRHFVIFNPVSGRGRGRRSIETYKALLDEHLDDVTYRTTTHAGEERDLASSASDDGYDVVVAVGGDGTWGNVADGLVRAGREGIALGILPSGTGNDFGRNLGYDPKKPQEAVHVLAAGYQRRVDVGWIDTPSAPVYAPDAMEQRHFLNVVGFGFDVAVIDAAQGARFLKGELLYKITALQQLSRFSGVRIGITGTDGTERDGTHLMLTVSNGRYFGGGFPIAPDASIDDGRLHACRIQDVSPFARFKLFNLAERGRHVTSDRVEVLADDGFRLNFDEPPRFEMDGDVRQSAVATVEVKVLPEGLSVVAPALA
jgi:diacylglycerol kinase (ATP)